jgi:hypothetical protein
MDHWFDSFESFYWWNYYEIKGVENAVESNAPNKSRTTKKNFRNRIVCLEGKFKIDVESIKRVVEIGGGIVIDTENETKPYEVKNANLKILILNDMIGFDYERFQYISMKVFFDSVLNFEKI